MTKLAILTGDTFEFRGRLKAYWTWDTGRKAWTRTADDSETPDSILRDYVRGIGGIRNRGSFSVAIEG